MQHYTINTQQVTWEITDGEAVIIHFETSAYYGLNASGTYAWLQLAEGPVDAGELAEKIAMRYGHLPNRVAADLDGFLQNAISEGLVISVPGNGSASPRIAETPCAAGAYEAPRLTKFGELEKLILSGE
ncbi:MAG TPA: PqqD family protein [Candidatus Binatia bacterium]